MIMKTSCELEKKLNKLPDDITVMSTCFSLRITKINKEWFIEYLDEANNTLLSVQHNKIQAAIDNTLASLKKIEYNNTPEGHLMSAIFGYNI